MCINISINDIDKQQNDKGLSDWCPTCKTWQPRKTEPYNRTKNNKKKCPTCKGLSDWQCPDCGIADQDRGWRWGEWGVVCICILYIYIYIYICIHAYT